MVAVGKNTNIVLAVSQSLLRTGGIKVVYRPFLCYWNDLKFFLLNSGGHYIAYCRNNLNNLWYEFDDQSVTEVSESTVQNAEAYVLFYR